jgi:hypothetical protein
MGTLIVYLGMENPDNMAAEKRAEYGRTYASEESTQTDTSEPQIEKLRELIQASIASGEMQGYKPAEQVYAEVRAEMKW